VTQVYIKNLNLSEAARHVGFNWKITRMQSENVAQTYKLYLKAKTILAEGGFKCIVNAAFLAQPPGAEVKKDRGEPTDTVYIDCLYVSTSTVLHPTLYSFTIKPICSQTILIRGSKPLSS
jgi:hypothetical protein